MIPGPDVEALGRALADLRHHRFGFYGPGLRDQLLGQLSTPVSARSYRLLRTVEVAGHAGLNLTQVADVLQCDAARATREVDALQRHALVRRRTDPHDRRRTSVHATAAGLALLAEAESMRAAYVAHTLAEWPEGDVRSLGELLARFNRDVEHHPVLPREGT